LIALSLAWVQPASAATKSLSSLVPADAVLYVEWSGHDALQGDAGKQSPFARLMADPEVKRMLAGIGAAVDGAMQQAGGGNPEQEQLLKAALALGKTAWSKGAAVALLGIEGTMAGPAPQLLLAINAGDSAPALLEQLKGLLAHAPMTGGHTEETIEGVAFQRYDSVAPLRAGIVNGIVLLTVGEPTAAKVLAVKAGKAPALPSSDRFAAAMKKMSGGSDTQPMLVAHLDAPNALATATQVMTAMTGETEFPPPAKTLLEELGVTRLQSITLLSEIAGGAHRHAVYVASPGPHKGLLKLLESAPLTDEDLAVIPSDATLAKAVNFRLSALYDEALRIVAALEPVFPQIPAAVNGAIGMAEATLGMKVRDDVLEAFDDGWAVYIAPSSGGLIITGLTLVVEAKDAAKMQKLIDTAMQFIQQAAGGPEELSVKTYEYAGHKISFVNFTHELSPVAPAWGFHERRLVVGLYPQMVGATLERLGSSAVASRSILENPDFSRLRGKLPKNCSSIVYLDTKKNVSDLYALALPLVTVGCSAAQREGVALDPSLFPRRDVFVRDLFPDVWGSSMDADGLLIVGQGPWPVPVPSLAGVAPLLAGAAMPLVMRPMMMADMAVAERAAMEPPTDDDALPPMEAAPADDWPPPAEAPPSPPGEEPPAPPADDTDSSQQLRTKLENITVALQLYSLQNREQFPPDLETLVRRGNLTEDDLRPPAEFTEPFEYVKGQTRKSDPRNVLVYHRVPGQGGFAATLDGEINYLDEQSLAKTLQETYQRLGG